MTDSGLVIITIAYLLDLAIGDPQTFFHPVRLIGLIIEKCENIFYKLQGKRLGGFLLVIIVLFLTLVMAYSLASLSIMVELFFIYTIFAARTLGNEGNKIFKLLKRGMIDDARSALSYIVSRNTEQMDEKDIVRSTIESIAENITDAVTAPIFYLFIGGLPLAMFYKAASTMDSMIGYKNDRYMKFGTVAARLDDILNFIPARLTGFIFIPLAALLSGKNIKYTFKTVIKYRLAHESPNSAYSESAVAGTLGVRLGGENIYFGKVSKKPFIGEKLKEFEVDDIKNAVRIMYLTSVAAFVFFMCLRIIIGRLIY